ncbi:hypothetical protein AVEN_6131-1 [Araneus ventricosus]|uniref:Uncharacterized protein n=1 Tax=Araneus ventricosus TaxID=182803 RepID=A0A4Y2G472_ARAVE|nr:hypothetical protein AVEN_6131-1 [Araneus ventricosus]
MLYKGTNKVKPVQNTNIGHSSALQSNHESMIRRYLCKALSLKRTSGRGGLVVRSRLWGRRVPGSKPDSTEDPPCMGPAAHAKHISSGQTSSRWCGVEAWRGGDASSGVVI